MTFLERMADELNAFYGGEFPAEDGCDVLKWWKVMTEDCLMDGVACADGDVRNTALTFLFSRSSHEIFWLSLVLV